MDNLIEVALSTERRLSTLESEMKEVKAIVARLETMLTGVIANINRGKGFWAGVIAAGTAFGAALGFLLSYIFQFKVGH